MRRLSPSFFHGQFDRSIIILCVRWYITYKLSYRDLVEMVAESGVDVSHTIILRWVQRYVPEFEKRWRGIVRLTAKDVNLSAAHAAYFSDAHLRLSLPSSSLPRRDISHCVWLYFRFALSFRDVEEMLAMRGVVLTYLTHFAAAFFSPDRGQVFIAPVTV